MFKSLAWASFFLLGQQLLILLGLYWQRSSFFYHTMYQQNRPVVCHITMFLPLFLRHQKDNALTCYQSIDLLHMEKMFGVVLIATIFCYTYFVCPMCKKIIYCYLVSVYIWSIVWYFFILIWKQIWMLFGFT